jgi:sulfotransferase family protein
MSPPLVFVVGSGRCGTHTLWRVFESLPDTVSTHEGNGTLRYGPADVRGKRLALGFMPELNAYLYHYAGEAVFQRTFALDEAMIAFMDRCFAGRANLIAWCRTNGIAYCDANPFGFNFISYIHRKFPTAKFVHLVRDGYDCVRSWSRRDLTTYPDGLPDATLVSWLLAKPMPLPGDSMHALWPALDRTERISWFWNTVNANIARRLEPVPDANKRVVKIEELDAASLPALLEFCGLPTDFRSEALAPDNTTDGPAIEWTPENRRKFEALAAPMMRALGYPLR